jgi:hypothetical protein
VGNGGELVAGILTYALWAIGAMVAMTIILLIIGAIIDSRTPLTLSQRPLIQRDPSTYRSHNNEALKGYLFGNAVAEYLNSSDDRDNEENADDDDGGSDDSGSDDGGSDD